MDSSPPQEFPPEGAPESHGEARRFSDEISLLLDKFEHDDVTVGEVVTLLKGRSYLGMLCLFSMLVAIPGMSTVFGLMISLIGLRLAFRRKPWLPRRMLEMRMSRHVFPKLLRGSNEMLRSIEKISKPRHEFFVDSPMMQHLTGLCVFVCGGLLMPPLPIPLTNFLPAAAVTVLAVANIGRDGLLVMVGYALFLASVALFSFLLLGGAAALDWLREQLDLLKVLS